MEENKKNTERRGSLVILCIAVIIILFIVIVGVCVNFFLPDETAGKITLLVLLGLLIVVGLLAFLILEYQRRADIKKSATVRDRAAEQWIRTTLDQQTRRPEPTAPPESTWALTTPFRYSKTSTVRA